MPGRPQRRVSGWDIARTRGECQRSGVRGRRGLLGGVRLVAAELRSRPAGDHSQEGPDRGAERRLRQIRPPSDDGSSGIVPSRMVKRGREDRSDEFFLGRRASSASGAACITKEWRQIEPVSRERRVSTRRACKNRTGAQWEMSSLQSSGAPQRPRRLAGPRQPERCLDRMSPRRSPSGHGSVHRPVLEAPA